MFNNRASTHKLMYDCQILVNVQLPEIAEVYIIASQESGGFCIRQLINQLGNIIEQLQIAFQAFGDNQQLEMIQELVRNFQVSKWTSKFNVM